MLTDVQTPFLGNPLIPSRNTSIACVLFAKRTAPSLEAPTRCIQSAGSVNESMRKPIAVNVCISLSLSLSLYVYVYIYIYMYIYIYILYNDTDSVGYAIIYYIICLAAFKEHMGSLAQLSTEVSGGFRSLLSARWQTFENAAPCSCQPCLFPLPPSLSLPLS